ncbi:unannotated protein [freshwater metagenome]|uniref:Unannotated protein n=1 Tax=freshwater metagenome TaxID=449393 RepID=A0A6J6LVB3_9ZZZZ
MSSGNRDPPGSSACELHGPGCSIATQQAVLGAVAESGSSLFEQGGDEFPGELTDEFTE